MLKIYLFADWRKAYNEIIVARNMSSEIMQTIEEDDGKANFGKYGSFSSQNK